MKEVSSSTDQPQNVYVAVPIGDDEGDMKASKSRNESSQCRKMHISMILLLLGISLFLVHKVMFYHHMSNAFYFAKHGKPCDHHVNFNPTPSDENHSHFMGPSGMYHPQPHKMRFEHDHVLDHHRMHPHNIMGRPETHHMDDIHHLLPPAELEPHILSKWELLEQKDSTDSEQSELDVWERIANFWTGSSESLDEGGELDIWERIADFWVGSGDHSKDSSDSFDSREEESSSLDVWERIAVYWGNSKDNSKDSSDSSE